VKRNTLSVALPCAKDGPDGAATYERARRLANQALWTIDLQRRRLNSDEPDDDQFVLRKWSDFHFLVVALTRLRRAVALAAKCPRLIGQIGTALETFDAALPHLKKMRDVAEHIDDYAVDDGKDRSVSRKSLEVGSCAGATWQWLGFYTDVDHALSASITLFEALKDCAPLIKEGCDRGRCHSDEAQTMKAKRRNARI
jgi:hypothetical protein